MNYVKVCFSTPLLVATKTMLYYVCTRDDLTPNADASSSTNKLSGVSGRNAGVWGFYLGFRSRITPSLTVAIPGMSSS